MVSKLIFQIECSATHVRYWLCHHPIICALIGIALNCMWLGALVLFALVLRAIVRHARAAPAQPAGDEDFLEGEVPAEEEAPPPQPLRVENAHELLNALPPEAYDLPPPQPQPPQPQLQPQYPEAIEALLAADHMLLERPNAQPDEPVPNAPPAAPAPADDRELQDDDEPEFQDALACDDVRAVPQAPSEGLRRRAPAIAAAAASSSPASTGPPPPALPPLQRSTAAAAPRALHNVPSSTSAQLKSRRSTSLERHYIDLT